MYKKINLIRSSRNLHYLETEKRN